VGSTKAPHCAIFSSLLLLPMPFPLRLKRLPKQSSEPATKLKTLKHRLFHTSLQNFYDNQYQPQCLQHGGLLVEQILLRRTWLSRFIITHFNTTVLAFRAWFQ
jgi:hypothetical protein